MPNLNEWIRKKTNAAHGHLQYTFSRIGKRSPKPTSYCIPPGLTIQFPRHTLTPTPSELDLPTSVTGSTFSPFFTMLPPELRRQILIHAFGARTIHISLTYAPTAYMHKLPSWRWESTLCYHHQLPNSEAWRDDCLSFGPGPSKYARASLRKLEGQYIDYARCCLGTYLPYLPWLLCSRQCYVEGLSVFWSTNRFCWHDTPLVYFMQEIFPRDRLAHLRDLEMFIDRNVVLDLTEHALRGFARNPVVYRELVETIGKELGGLRRLFIAWNGPGCVFLSSADEAVVEEPGREEGERLEKLSRMIMEPVDGLMAMWSAAGRQVEVQLAVNYTFYIALERREKKRGAKDGGSGGPARIERGEGETFWQRFLRTVPPVQEGSIAVASRDTSRQLEYWIRKGVDDRPIPWLSLL